MPQPQKQARRLKLPERLDLTATAVLLESFVARRGHGLIVDASRVERLSTPCVQVLLSAAATWRADGLMLRVLKPSADMMLTLNSLGIAPQDVMIEGSQP